MPVEETLQRAKLKLGQKIPCTIEVITPVHIGSGVKLAKGIDFLFEGGGIKIVKAADLFSYLEENPEELTRFTANNNLLSSLRRQPPSTVYPGIPADTKEISEFERDGNGCPYIPGSSVKGAVRTVILKHLFGKLERQQQKRSLPALTPVGRVKKEAAAEQLMKTIFGNDPNHNAMRVLRIFDAYFQQNDLDISTIYILSLTQGGYGWKNLRSRQNGALGQATPVMLESLMPGAKANISIQWDDFLFNNEEAKSKLRFPNNDFKRKAVITGINAYAQKYLEKEKAFYAERDNAEFSPIINHIDNLLEKVPGDDNTSECLLRISWGGGWRGMTGDFLDDETLANIRGYFKLGREGAPTFPKTRRIVFKDNKPSALTGWVKIKFDDEVKKEAVFNQAASQHEAKKADSNISEEDLLKALSGKFKVTKKR